MINSKMYELGSRRSVIREIFEYGKKRKAEIGEDKVFDFSIGNPSVESPEAVADRIKEMTGELAATMARTGIRDLKSFDPTVIHQRRF